MLVYWMWKRSDRLVIGQANVLSGAGAEESDFDVLLAKDLGVLVKRVPCWLTDA